MNRQLRILFLEDRPADFELELHELLRDGTDIAAVRVETEDEYVRQLEAFAPDVIIADYALPAYDGLGALEMARRKCPDVPFIFVSGAMGEEVAVEALRHGATDYVLKQRLTRLRPAVQRALREAGEKKKLRRAEQEIRDSAALYHSLVENLPQHVFRKDVSGRFTFVNQRFCSLLGKSAEQILGKTVFDLMPPETASRYQEDDHRILENGDPLETVKEFVSTGGAVRFVQLIMTPLHNAMHQITGIQGIFWDITESRRAEARIRHLNQLLRAIRDIHSLMVKQRDARKLLQDACAILVQARGYLLVWIGEAEAGSTRVIPVARAGSQVDYVDEITITTDEALTGQGPVGMSMRNRELRIVNNVATDPSFEPWRKPAMARGYGSVASFPLILGSSTVGALAVYADRPGAFDPEEINLLNELAADLAYALRSIEDETERNLLQKQFIEAQKMEAIGRLAGGIAHDFNNLLTIIIGCSNFLLSDIPPDNPAHADAEQIKNAGTRAAALASKLLAFSRKQILRPRVIDLNAAVQENSRLLRRVIGEDIDLVTFPAPDLGSVKADPTQIEQVIMNLAVNARDAMPDGGKLTLETANVDLDQSFVSSHSECTMGAFVMLAIKDTGTGMDAETRAHLFEPFFTTKEEGKGTGLGLATVYGIVKQCGGYITVDSAPGRGSTFRIYFPRVDEAAEKTKAAPMSVAGGSETILVVEDMEEVRAMAVRALQAKGYKVLESKDGPDALKAASEYAGKIDLVATDLILPGGINGRELAGRLATSRPGVKVLYISGYAGVLATKDFADPNLAFLPKPYTGEDLARKVREVLQKNA
jgi:PAS domain S-box-containing protein